MTNNCPNCGRPVDVWADHSGGVTVNFACDNPDCASGKGPWDTPRPHTLYTNVGCPVQVHGDLTPGEWITIHNANGPVASGTVSHFRASRACWYISVGLGQRVRLFTTPNGGEVARQIEADWRESEKRDFPPYVPDDDDDDGSADRVAAHEQWLGTEGADHLFPGAQ